MSLKFIIVADSSHILACIINVLGSNSLNFLWTSWTLENSYRRVTVK